MRACTARVRGQSAPISLLQLEQLPFVTGLQSAWTVPPQAEATLVSQDGRTGLIVAGITGGETGAQEHAKQVSACCRTSPASPARVRPDQRSPFTDQTNKDLLVMEAIAVPLSFVLLVWVFGGLLAAALPWRSACSRSSARWP